MNALAIGVWHGLAGKETRVNRSLSILEYDNALAKRSSIAVLIFAGEHSGILCQQAACGRQRPCLGFCRHPATRSGIHKTSKSFKQTETLPQAPNLNAGRRSPGVSEKTMNAQTKAVEEYGKSDKIPAYLEKA